MLSATSLFTSAQLKACDVTPLVLVAAPGANKLIVPATLVGFYHYGTVDYVSAGFRVYVGVDDGGAWACSWNGVLVGSASLLSGIDLAAEMVEQGSGAPATAINHTLALQSGSPPTLGDGTLTVVSYYAVADFS
jgi:hypothetical protein